MKKPHVVLIGFEEYDNLGLGYLASSLSVSGIETKILNFCSEREDILKSILECNPVVVGFSIIFQNYIDKFSELISFLRTNNILCHFTAGGHYASLRSADLFRIIPELDSIVRFEGEKTLPELVDRIITGQAWRKTTGIVYKTDGKIVINPLRKVETDLDVFPFPVRHPPGNFAFGKKFATIIAGRGCVYNCIYCSSREFTKRSNGPVKRIRKPDMVVREMRYLNTTQKCSVFLFEDDDFPVKSEQYPSWIESFCDELQKAGLSGRIMWKINCRPDEVDEKKFKLMYKNGLRIVFIGLEDGTEEGLKYLNKKMTPANSLAGIEIIKKLGIGFDFGFMLFQPITTFDNLNQNIEFLEQISMDGYTPVSYLKLIPYYETTVEKELKKEGRLKGSLEYPDYDFKETAMNEYYSFITNCFGEWLQHPYGLTNLSRWARNYFSACSAFFRRDHEFDQLNYKYTLLVSESNKFFLNTHKELLHIFKNRKNDKKESERIDGFREVINSRHGYFKNQVWNIIRRLSYSESNSSLNI